LGSEADRVDVVVVLAIAGLVAVAVIEGLEFAVERIAAPDAIALSAATAWRRTLGESREND
jgi:hypothetical protein